LLLEITTGAGIIRAQRGLPAAWMISNMDAYIIKLTVIAALLITILLLIDDLIRHPAPDAEWVETPDGIQLRFTRPLPR